MGSVIALSSSTGAVLIKYSYDSFGLPKILSGSTLVDFRNYTGNKYSNVRLFTGREHDRETGYYYMRARYYNAENSGRFINRDPIGQNDQVNLYTYVRNSPLMGTDRDGRKESPLTAKDYLFDFAGNLVGTIVESGYHVINGISYGTVDWLSGVQDNFSSQNNSSNPIGFKRGYNQGWKSGTESNYLVDTAAIMYGGMELATSYAAKPIINMTNTAILKNGYYEVNGFKFSKFYYEKLWNTGRGGPSLVANEILKNSPKIVSDRMKGFSKYIIDGWEMVYNSSSKEVWHLVPKK